jgi:hypothetical protein
MPQVVFVSEQNKIGFFSRKAFLLFHLDIVEEGISSILTSI